MTAQYAVGERAIGESTRELGAFPLIPFNWLVTVISQYANSPILLKLLENFSEYIDPSANVDAFFNLVFNVDTAHGCGLDVWGRIVGVSRVLYLPVDTPYFGFSESASSHSFNESIFFGGGTLTSNFSLADDAFRQLILAKALGNICDGSIPAVNRILTSLFGGYGNCYVVDNLDMSLDFSFAPTLSIVDFAIVSQAGVLPRPVGVSINIVQR